MTRTKINIADIIINVLDLFFTGAENGKENGDVLRRE